MEIAVCKECKNNSWDLVFHGIDSEYEGAFNLYQCKNCKRCVVERRLDVLKKLNIKTI